VNHVAIEFALTAIATRSLSASERPPSASSASALSAAGYQVYAVNPLAVARYRDRHQVSGAKSDTGDAKLLADLVRTDRHNHRPLSGDSAQAEAIKVLARGHQNLIWARTRHTNALRSALREYYPAALQAFDDLADRDALAVLGRAPQPPRGRSSKPGQGQVCTQTCWATTQHRCQSSGDPRSVAHRAAHRTLRDHRRIRRGHPRRGSRDR
jgi:hypothetical protein